MAKSVKVQSKELEVLDKLGVPYEIKTGSAFLKDWDSLQITLSGKYQGGWKRWSNGVYGANYKSLVSYMVEQGLVDAHKAAEVLGDLGDTKFGKVLTVKESEPYDFSTMVTNPHHEIVDEYLHETRHISENLISKLFEMNVLKQDGRDNARFMWLDENKQFTGADVQGTYIDYEKYEKRGTLKMILPGSKGFFHLETADVKDFSNDVLAVYLFEAPIDLISYINLNAYNHEPDNHTMYLALSGAETKVIYNLEYLKEHFKVDPEKVVLHVNTDNDTAGDLAFKELKAKYPNVVRDLPNKGKPILDKATDVARVPKDWNELLQMQH